MYSEDDIDFLTRKLYCALWLLQCVMERYATHGRLTLREKYVTLQNVWYLVTLT